MPHSHDEWLTQADYDVETAQAMLNAGRYFYAVFMCHLAIEKALKGAICAKTHQLPPRTHNLVYLAELTHHPFTKGQSAFMAKLAGASVATRYPEELRALKRLFPRRSALAVLSRTRELIACLRNAYKKP
jgi:HEPN domain-containing protein